MKFIQSSNEKNPIVNLELIISIEKNKDGIFLCSNNDNYFWDGNQKQLNEDWQTICNALNNDLSSSNVIK